MKWLALALAAMALVACEVTPVAIKPQAGIARITFYNKHEDKFGSRIASSKRGRARIGKTIAAESCSYPFGTKIIIPRLAGVIGDGTFTVEDRGSAVEKRRASHGRCPVFDIYAGTKRQMKRWVKLIPEYLPFKTL